MRRNFAMATPGVEVAQGHAPFAGTCGLSSSSQGKAAGVRQTRAAGTGAALRELLDVA